eukprot:462830-Amphidinium_carterae.1
MASVAYGTLRTMLSRDTSEDVVDFFHAVGTSAVSGCGWLAMEPHASLGRALPLRLSCGRGPVVRMFAVSLGYFIGDFFKILMDVTVRWSFPNLWLGRLVHHSIQLGATLPAIFGPAIYGIKSSADVTLACRSLLCMAYVAEFSSIFLRLSNIARRAKTSKSVQQLCSWAVLTSFFASRIVNFAWAIRLFLASRSVFPESLFRIGAIVQTGGYSLSLVWFFKLLRNALRTNGFAKLR